MSVKRTPPRSLGMTEIPGKVTVKLGSLVTVRRVIDGKRRRVKVRRATARDVSALTAIFESIRNRPTTFDAMVKPTEELARRYVEKAGGVNRSGWSDSSVEAWQASHQVTGYTMHGAYLIPGHVEEASELHYALEILWHLTFARSNDIDDARRYAWLAGQHAQEAHLKFKWEPDALAGKRSRAQGHRGHEGGRPTKRRADADRWLAEHDTEVRARAARRRTTREQLVTWALSELGPACGRTVMHAALTAVLGPARPPHK